MIAQNEHFKMLTGGTNIMRKIAIVLFGILSMSFFVFQACEDNPTGTDSGTINPSQDKGRVTVHAMDTPIAGSVTEVNLHVKQVSIHRADTSANDSTSGWITIANTDTVINFLELINGETSVLADTLLAPGHYTQLRLLLDSDNTIVVDGVELPLTIPSGTQTGVKLNLDFNIEANQVYQVYLDFNASKSIHQRGNLGNFIMRPTFRVFMHDISGTISGTVSDTLGSPINHASVYAAQNGDTTATLTDSTGQYKMILEEGTYDISTELEHFISVDTSYSNVEVNADDELTGYDFTFIY